MIKKEAIILMASLFTVLTSIPMKIIAIQSVVYDILFDMGLPPKSITNTASFQKDLGIDSLDFAELVMELENRLYVNISIVEIEGVTTVQSMIDYLQTLNRK